MSLLLKFALIHRACAEAWAAGGLEGERKEGEMWQTRERRKIQESLDAMTAIKENALRRRQARELLEKGKLTICSHINYRSKVWGHYDFLINFNFYSARMH